MNIRSAVAGALLLTGLFSGCQCVSDSGIACYNDSQCPTPGNICSVKNQIFDPQKGDPVGHCEPGTRTTAPDGSILMDGGADSGISTDAGIDAGTDAGVDAGADAGIDAGIDAGTDGGIDMDAGSDAGTDAGLDMDAGIDAGSDAGTDGGIVIVIDGGTDGGSVADAGTDAGTDAGIDAGTDAGIDAGTDAGTEIDGGIDAGVVVSIPDTSPGGPITYTRIPWGAVQSSYAAQFTVTGTAGTVPAGIAEVLASDAPDTNPDDLIGSVAPSGNGSFSLTLTGGDRAIVYLAYQDSSGNDSATAQIHNIVWVASYGNKVSGSTTANPNVLTTASDLNLADAGAAGLLGSLDQPLGAAEATSYAGVQAVGGTSLDVSADMSVWEQRTPPSSSTLPALSGHAMAYDSARGRIVLFGGANTSGVLTGDTYEWDGLQWTLESTTGPTPRAGHAMAYDAASGCVLLFGGQDASGSEADTWAWNGTTWADVTPADPSQSPSARYGHALAYDSSRGRVVLFGGQDASGTEADTWEWNGTQWTEATPSGNSPTGRKWHGMDFDAAHGETVLYGGCTGSTSCTGLQDTWEWNGTTWTNPASSGPPALVQTAMAYDATTGQSLVFGGSESLTDAIWGWNGSSWQNLTPASGPTARYSHAMAYDSARNRLVAFGGINGSDTTLDDLWIWTGARWLNATPAASPSARESHAMVYDSTNDVTVLFGGEGSGSSQLDDTWEWNGYSWADQSTVGSPGARSGHAMTYDSSNDVAVLFGGVSGSTVDDDTWQWDGSANTWTNVTPPPPILGPLGGLLLPTSPPASEEAGFAFDAAEGNSVLFGGSSSASSSTDGTNGTWVWATSARTWTNDTPLGTSPSDRYLPAMDYDAAHSETYLFGGTNTGTSWLTDTYEWSGSAWSKVTPSGASPAPDGMGTMVYDSTLGASVLFFGTSAAQTWAWNGTAWVNATSALVPPTRGGQAMVYDSTLDEAVLFGGSSGSNLLSDTWIAASDPTRRAGAIAAFDFGAADATAPTITGMTLVAYIGGTGHTLAVGGTSAAVNGASLAVWDAWSGGWKSVGANNSAVASPAEISYTTANAAEATGYLLPTTDTINLGMCSTAGLGNGATPPEVAVDYVQLTVDYQQ